MCRRISGAMIRISNTEEHEASGKMERAITISGQADAVNVAKTLINLRLLKNIGFIIFNNCFYNTILLIVLINIINLLGNQWILMKN